MKPLLLYGTFLVILAAAYIIFLARTWNAFQSDRQNREAKINELLDRLPKKEA